VPILGSPHLGSGPFHLGFGKGSQARPCLVCILGGHVAWQGCVYHAESLVPPRATRTSLSRAPTPCLRKRVRTHIHTRTHARSHTDTHADVCTRTCTQAIRLQELKFQMAVRDQIIFEQRAVISNLWKIINRSGMGQVCAGHLLVPVCVTACKQSACLRCSAQAGWHAGFRGSNCEVCWLHLWEP